VGENGGLWAWMGPKKLELRFQQAASERAVNRARLEALSVKILQDIPGCALASDQSYRALDLAIDFCEDVEPLGDSEVAQIVAAFEGAGARCKVSSIHVNGWFGEFDKLSGVRRLLQDRWKESLDPNEWVYVGDSPNDEPMFGQFPHSVGVANVSHFLPRMKDWPAWITDASGGHGFAQLALQLLAEEYSAAEV
jgi:hydroxymethylpyrimidine pyrophosphatase-like HAD family hydrolase